jgi:hypothetical protein
MLTPSGDDPPIFRQLTTEMPVLVAGPPPLAAPATAEPSAPVGAEGHDSARHEPGRYEVVESNAPTQPLHTVAITVSAVVCEHE